MNFKNYNIIIIIKVILNKFIFKIIINNNLNV